MKHEIIIKFYPLKNEKNINSTLMLELKINGVIKRHSTSKTIAISDWNFQSNSLRKTTANKTITAYMKNTTLMLLSAHKNLIREGKVDVDHLYYRVFETELYHITLLEVFDRFLEELKPKISVYVTHYTFRMYNQTRKKLANYLSSIDDPGFQIQYLERCFIQNFNDYLLKEQYAINSVYIFIQTLKRVSKYAYEKNITLSDPFVNYHADQEYLRRDYLTLKELKTLENLKLSYNGHQKARDFFLFQCYTGLSFVDLRNLTKRQIQNGIDNKPWLILNRHKTGVRSAIPLVPRAIDIINTAPLIYLYRKHRIQKNKVFTVYDLTSYNRNLKEIIQLAKIDKHITSHCGRKTFANTLTYNQGVSLDTISSMLGHSTYSSTYRYAEVNEVKLLSEMKKVRKALAILNS